MFEPDMLSGESDLVRNANVNMLRGKGMTELDAMRQSYGAQPRTQVPPMGGLAGAMPGLGAMAAQAPPMQPPAPAPMGAPPMQAPAATLPQPNAQAFAHASPNAAFMRPAAAPAPNGPFGGRSLAEILAHRAADASGGNPMKAIGGALHGMF